MLKNADFSVFMAFYFVLVTCSNSLEGIHNKICIYNAVDELINYKTFLVFCAVIFISVTVNK